MTVRRQTLIAGRWATASSLFRAALQVAQTMVLARLLAPSDFGLMAMAGAAVAVAGLFADFGLSSALMHFPKPDRRMLSTIYWLNIGIACGLGLLFALLSWPISAAFQQPELLPVLWWLSLSFPLSALGQPFRVLAEKELRFAALGQQEMMSALLGFLAAMAVASRGGGVFAFVVGSLVATASTSALAWLRLSASVRPIFSFALAQIGPFIRFGMHRVGDTLWNTLRMQADIFIAGLFVPPAAIAIYAVPRDQCLRISNTVINPVVTRIGLPVMTRLRDDLPALRLVYQQTLRLTASLNFPLYALVALFPADIVTLLLGGQWIDAGFYLRMFALWGIMRSVGNPSGSLVYAVGMARRAHLWNLLYFVSVVPVFLIAVRWGGLPALAWAMLVLQAAVFVLAWRFLVHPACGIRFMPYIANLVPPFGITLIAAAAAFAMTSSITAALWRLVTGIVTLGIVYLALSWWLNRQWAMTMIELLTPILPLRRKAN